MSHELNYVQLFVPNKKKRFLHKYLKELTEKSKHTVSIIMLIYNNKLLFATEYVTD